MNRIEFTILAGTPNEAVVRWEGDMPESDYWECFIKLPKMPFIRHEQWDKLSTAGVSWQYEQVRSHIELLSQTRPIAG